MEKCLNFQLKSLAAIKEKFICKKGESMYELGSLVEMKKPHACTIKTTGKKANCWEVVRIGADIKIKCTNCDHVVMMSRHDFERKIKKVL